MSLDEPALSILTDNGNIYIPKINISSCKIDVNPRADSASLTIVMYGRLDVMLKIGRVVQKLMNGEPFDQDED